MKEAKKSNEFLKSDTNMSVLLRRELAVRFVFARWIDIRVPTLFVQLQPPDPLY